MEIFSIQVGRDARVYYKANIQAESLEAAQAMVSRHGFNAPDGTTWSLDGTDEFDHVETVAISDASGDAILASYSDGDGWESI